MTARVSRSVRALTVVAIAGALTILAAVGPASAAVEPPAYYPSGPQTNVDQSELEGWTLCYSGLYADEDIPLYGPGGILDELCTGEYLMLAGGPLDDPVLTVLAAAPRVDVLTDTTNDFSTTHNANGSEWYFNDDWSWGFALGGDAVEKSECDTANTNAEYRLCFHVFDQHLTYGYRAGASGDLNVATDWARYIYQSNGVEVPELAATGPAESVTPYLAGGLLIAGVAVLIARGSVLARRDR